MKAALAMLFALVAVAYAAPKPQVKGGTFCSMCETVVTMVEKYLDDDEAQIEQEIDDYVCDAFGQGSFDQMCRMMVHMFLPQIIKYLEQGMTAEQICEQLGLC